LDQARFFIKKGWWDDAKEELVKTTEDPNGRLDAEAWFLLAHLQFQLCDIGAARTAIEQAHTHALDPEQLRQIQALENTLSEDFGWVSLPPKLRDPSDTLISQATAYSPESRAYLHRLQQRLQASQTLPESVALPAGRYLFNGRPFQVSSGQVALIPETRERSPTVWRAVLATGAGGWFGSNELGRYGQIALGLEFQVGGLVLEGQGHWSGPNSSLRTGFGGGIWVGHASQTRPWSVSGLVGLRTSLMQPVDLGCTHQVAAVTLCGLGTGTDLLVTPLSWGLIPTAGLKLQRHWDGWGLGLGVFSEWAFGRLAASGKAIRLADGATIRYTVDASSRSWRSLGVRSSLHLSRDF